MLFPSLLFSGDNFTNYVGNDGAAITMMKYTSVFLLAIRGMHYVVQNNASKKIKKDFTLLNALVWGACGCLTLTNWSTSKEPNSYVNLGLQILFTVGYAHQYSNMKDK